MRTKQSYAFPLMGLLILFGGCGIIWETESRQKVDLGVDPSTSAMANSAAYRDTIGARTFYQGLNVMRVRGYGLVSGLGKNGSKECPQPVFGLLAQSMYKDRRASSSQVGTTEVTPEQLIARKDTAVVLVSGEIPPAAVRGSRFDLSITVIPRTQTKSLSGGWLLPSDLVMYRDTMQGTISGKSLARGGGPILLNPFSDEESATRSNVLEGVVVGGGVVTQARRIRLVMTEPSYPWVCRIRDRINARFAGTQLVADATSPSFVQLRIPDAYRDNPEHFLGLVRALYATERPRFEAVRIRELAEELLDPEAPHDLIALCFEGIGRHALPVLGELYVNPDPRVSYQAALAGLRIGDHIACDVVALHALDAEAAFRLEAIGALAEAKGMAPAAMALRKLLDDADPRVRIAAYEGLVKRGDATIVSRPIGEGNFVLDLVPSEESNFVYARRTGERRIALFGRDLHCLPPLLYRSPDGSVTLNAHETETSLTILRTHVATGAMSAPIPTSFALPSLVRLLGNEAGVRPGGEVDGLGIDFGAVVRALHHLCADESINARFILEQTDAAKQLGPAKRAGRSESEL